MNPSLKEGACPCLRSVLADKRLRDFGPHDDGLGPDVTGRVDVGVGLMATVPTPKLCLRSAVGFVHHAAAIASPRRVARTDGQNFNPGELRLVFDESPELEERPSMHARPLPLAKPYPSILPVAKFSSQGVNGSSSFSLFADKATLYGQKKIVTIDSPANLPHGARFSTAASIALLLPINLSSYGGQPINHRSICINYLDNNFFSTFDVKRRDAPLPVDQASQISEHGWVRGEFDRRALATPAMFDAVTFCNRNDVAIVNAKILGDLICAMPFGIEFKNPFFRGWIRNGLAAAMRRTHLRLANSFEEMTNGSRRSVVSARNLGDGRSSIICRDDFFSVRFKSAVSHAQFVRQDLCAVNIFHGNYACGGTPIPPRPEGRGISEKIW